MFIKEIGLWKVYIDKNNQLMYEIFRKCFPTNKKVIMIIKNTIFFFLILQGVYERNELDPKFI